MTLTEQKQAARRLARQKLRQLSPEDCTRCGRSILELVRRLPQWQTARTVLCFASMPGEPDTSFLLDEILTAGKTLCLPRQTKAPGIMQAHQVADLSALVCGPYGIREPAAELPVIPPEQIDLILAPCLAASRDRVRLGHGCGYYDRFFAQSPAFRAVLCPSVLLYDRLPADDLDLPAHLIITETEIL